MCVRVPLPQHKEFLRPVLKDESTKSDFRSSCETLQAPITSMHNFCSLLWQVSLNGTSSYGFIISAS